MKLYVVYEVEDGNSISGDIWIVGACSTKERALAMIEEAANKRYNSLDAEYTNAEKPVFTTGGWRAHISGGDKFYDMHAIEYEDGVIDDDFLGS